MQYLLLLYGNEADDLNATPEEQQAMIAEYSAYDDLLQDAGVLRGGFGLHPTPMATSVRAREGKALVTHGPFAETKEQLGGYYVIECLDLDAAVSWALKCPAAQTGTVEVRPIMDLSGGA